MAHGQRGKRSGNRGSDSRPSKGFATIERFAMPQGAKSTWVLAEAAAVMHECDESTFETVETHIIPRKSLTQTQHLNIGPREAEFVPMDCIRRDPLTGVIIEVIQRNRRVWQADRTLLIQGQPGQLDEMNKGARAMARRTSRSKIKIWERETTIEPSEKDQALLDKPTLDD